MLDRRTRQPASGRSFAVLTPLLADGTPQTRWEVRGTVVEIVRGAAAREHIDARSQRCEGHRFRNTITSERVSLEIRPDRELVR